MATATASLGGIVPETAGSVVVVVKGTVVVVVGETVVVVSTGFLTLVVGDMVVVPPGSLRLPGSLVVVVGTTAGCVVIESGNEEVLVVDCGGCVDSVVVGMVRGSGSGPSVVLVDGTVVVSGSVVVVVVLVVVVDVSVVVVCGSCMANPETTSHGALSTDQYR